MAILNRTSLRFGHFVHNSVVRVDRREKTNWSSRRQSAMRKERSHRVNLTATSVVVAAFSAYAWPIAATAKTPGQVHCYGGFCHRVKAIDEMPSLVGNVTDVVATFYDSPDKDRFNTGTLTSSGEVFDAEMSTRTSSSIYPDGTELLVWNPANGRAAHVRVNDFGPFFLNRTLDLTRRVADDLDFVKAGVASLRLIVVFAPSTAEATYKRERTYPKVRGYLGMMDRAEFERTGAELTVEALSRNGRPRNPWALASEPSTMVHKYRQSLAQAPEIPPPRSSDYEVRVAAAPAVGSHRMDVLADMHAWDAAPSDALLASAEQTLARNSASMVVAALDPALIAAPPARRPVQVTVLPEMRPAIDLIPESEAMPVEGVVTEAPAQQVAVLDLKLSQQQQSAPAERPLVIAASIKSNRGGEPSFWSQVQNQWGRVAGSPNQQGNQQLLLAQLLMGLLAVATVIKWRTSGTSIPVKVPVPVPAPSSRLVVAAPRSRATEYAHLIDAAEADFQVGDYARAATSYRRALDVSESEHGPNHPSTLDHLCRWAKALAAQSDFVGLEVVQRRLTVAYETLVGPSDARLMQSYRDLAETRLLIGRTDDAALALEVALNLAEARGTTELAHVDGADSSANAAQTGAFSDMADILCDLAVIHFKHKRLEPAADHATRALSIRQQIGTATTRAGAVTLSILGEVERASGNAQAAETWHRQAWALFAHGPEADLTDAAASALSLAGVMIDGGQYDSARQVFEANVPVISMTLGAGHPAVAAAFISWAELHRGTGDQALEYQALEQAHRIQVAHYGADHPDTKRTAERLAMVAPIAA
jgi:rare lipoprotein A (peptidoglycan hydrolase)/tetratricopeptide (TPR) repeat protein